MQWILGWKMSFAKWWVWLRDMFLVGFGWGIGIRVGSIVMVIEWVSGDEEMCTEPTEGYDNVMLNE
jgi:energy-converting hydrogenase Eha subunit G